MNGRIWSSIVLVSLLIITSVIPPVQATDTGESLLDDYVEDVLGWLPPSLC